MPLAMVGGGFDSSIQTDEANHDSLFWQQLWAVGKRSSPSSASPPQVNYETVEIVSNVDMRNEVQMYI